MSDTRTIVENVKKVPKGARAEAPATTRATGPDAAELHKAIGVIAYQYAERRNFEPGHDMEDWLNAESEVLAELEGLKGFPA
ncbi:MAG: DUF2934 domain-containing protein [Betaproteobacteria bacterium]|jgi:hypothetical protein